MNWNYKKTEQKQKLYLRNFLPYLKLGMYFCIFDLVTPK